MDQVFMVDGLWTDDKSVRFCASLQSRLFQQFSQHWIQKWPLNIEHFITSLEHRMMTAVYTRWNSHNVHVTRRARSQTWWQYWQEWSPSQLHAASLTAAWSRVNDRLQCIPTRWWRRPVGSAGVAGRWVLSACCICCWDPATAHSDPRCDTHSEKLCK